MRSSDMWEFSCFCFGSRTYVFVHRPPYFRSQQVLCVKLKRGTSLGGVTKEERIETS